jgi:hypothetical protein
LPEIEAIPRLTILLNDVIPVKTGIQTNVVILRFLDSRFHGNDGKSYISSFCESIKNGSMRLKQVAAEVKMMTARMHEWHYCNSSLSVR